MAILKLLCNMGGVLVLLLCYFLGFKGVHGRILLSDKDHIELEKRLALLNKPAVKTIQTDYGDLYDCVDFYKQPAFDHPLLRNHSYNFKMEPKFMGEEKNMTFSKVRKSSNIGLADGGCPTGTVPIRRITKDDLIREKLYAEKFLEHGTYYAVVQTKHYHHFAGAVGRISLYNPQVEKGSYSEARIKIQNGEYGDEFIQSGWRVDPVLYGDNRTHFFVQVNTPSAKCFDARCGFVVISPEVSPGLPYKTTSMSIRGGTIHESKNTIKRDQEGNWWVLLGEGDIKVGFWPNKLFTELYYSGTFVDWGGEVFGPPGTHLPPMGSSHRPIDDTDYDAYVAWIAVYDTDGNMHNPGTRIFTSDELRSFNVLDQKRHDDFYGHIALFGGCTPYILC